MAMLASTASGAEYKFKLAHEVAVESTQHLAATRFAELVKDRTNGGIEITVYPNSGLGAGPQALNLLRGGIIDIVQSGSTTFNGLVGETAALELPFLFRDAGHAYRVLDGKVGQSVLDKLTPHGVQGLAFLENGWREMTNSRRPIRSHEDIKGLKIRTTPNPFHIQAFELLGANPVPMAYSELYSALETGAVDAQEHPLPVLWAAKYYEIQKYLTLTHHAYSPLILVMNKRKFDSLPAEYRTILIDSARETAAYQRDLNAKQVAEIIAGLKEAGMEVIEEIDTTRFRQIVEDPLRESFAEKYGMDLLSAIAAEM
ncbi:TRAP transporter substrate-binding protein (plasmid) [Skermanella rosea]|uniref:TRAP transporter substrate-binding protein n=1 Tax=Skermanella rosea TaxID=1817965 RepID=UPI0019344A68|nr:TRAP transporter substrate-binding protein [Skermanella rosea]UEM07170.1 TRAP transporter substrate-binding protein [Skermanella rosea]